MKTSDKETKRGELIEIGEPAYCRINNYNWNNSENACHIKRSPGISNIVGSRFSVETVKRDGKRFKLYREYTVFKSRDSLDPKEMILSFYEQENWVDEQCVMTAEESVLGLENPKQIQFKAVRQFENDPPNLRIEAPVK